MELKRVSIFLLLLLFGLQVVADSKDKAKKKAKDEDDPVLTLTSDNFTEIVSNKDIILVEFYAPWCGHCKNLAPEYKVAARELKNLDPPIPLAKVDATSNEDLAQKYGIDGYPIMKVFRKGTPYEYEGPRKADGIVKYMKQQASPDWKPPADHILLLTKDNFTDFTQNSDIILVEFYAPWCGHCKKLAPQYKKAADMLHKANTGILLAAVDATIETDLAKQFGVDGYPTLKIFRRGKVSEYNGPRDAKGIAGYMMKQSEPATTILVSSKEFAMYLKEDAPIVVGFFASEESREFKAYEEAANQGREELLAFKHTTDESLAKKYKLELNTAGVFLPRRLQSKHEPAMKIYKGSFTVSPQELLTSFKNLARPLVGLRTRANVQKLYSDYPILVGYISNEEEEDSFDYWRSKLIPLAKKYPDITFAISDEKEFKEELKLLGMDERLEDIVVALWAGMKEKYAYDEDEVTTDELDDFIQAYKSGKAKPVRRSQPKPAKQSGPLTVVVSDTFDEIVRDPTKDVFIEFYAPWCGHCKALAPKYKDLAKKYEDNDKLVIANFDAHSNDAPPDFEFSGFPTIFFVPAGKDSKPVVYEGGREVKDMVEYLEKEAHFSLGGSDKDEL